MVDREIVSLVSINYSTSENKNKLKRMKEYNFNAFASIDRSRLTYGKRERLLLLHITKANEYVCIKYPGKETVSPGEKQRPWDFKPIVIFPDHSDSGDISFSNIWDEFHKINEKDPSLLPIFASLFGRMAYMVDHREVSESFDLCSIDSSGKKTPLKPYNFSFFKYMPDSTVLDYLEGQIGKLLDMSVEAFMMVNDLIAQNEDCKYYYRDTVVKQEQTYNMDVGRKNFLLTNMSVIGLYEGKLRLSKVLQNLAKYQVYSPTQTEINAMTNDYFHIES